VSHALGRTHVSFPRREAAGSANTSASASRKVFSGDSLGIRSLRESLAALHEEIGHCLTDLLLLEEGPLDNRQKHYASHAFPKTQQASMGSKATRPISKKSVSTFSVLTPSETAQISKGKAPLGFPIKKPKLVVKAKAGSHLRPIPTPLFSLHAGASTSAAQQVLKDLDSGVSALGSGTTVQVIPAVSINVGSLEFLRLFGQENRGSSLLWVRA
jgi:hypothetical protein